MNKKIVIILLADKSSHENKGRALHALLYAKQIKKQGLEVKLIFDGGGTEWAVEFPKNDQFKKHYQELIDTGVVEGVCFHCAGAFHVGDELKALGVNFLSEDNGHPNIGALITDGWETIVI